jgi:hypothetical protein
VDTLGIKGNKFEIRISKSETNTKKGAARLMEREHFVGWVERSETQQLQLTVL